MNIPVAQKPLIEGNLLPLVNVPVPGVHELGKADVSYTMRTDYNIKGDGLFNMGTAERANDTFIPSDTPTLLQIISGARDLKDFKPQGTIYTLPANKVIVLLRHCTKADNRH